MGKSKNIHNNEKPNDSKNSSYLSKDDQELWNKIAKTTKPLEHEYRDRVPNIEVQEKKKVNKTPPRPQVQLPSQPPQSNQTPSKQKNINSTPITEIDRKKIRKIATDQIEIHATLDLHGYRQEQAHTALKSFIRNAQVQGYRYVLIITGKGITKKTSQSGFWQEEQPGVLKRKVPEWLSDQDLREYVVSYSSAHPKHGGEGALYVQIRKLKNR